LKPIVAFLGASILSFSILDFTFASFFLTLMGSSMPLVGTALFTTGSFTILVFSVSFNHFDKLFISCSQA
jgi:uncharacterized membrane protein